MNIISPSTHVVYLGISMSSDCTFDLHISNLYRRCTNLAGWILRTFTMRDLHLMLTLFKSLVLSRLDYAGVGRLSTLKYNRFRWQSIRMFNKLPKCICMLSSCSVNRFIDSYLRNIVDLPCQPGFNNSLDGGDCLHGGHYADDLAAKQTEEVCNGL